MKRALSLALILGISTFGLAGCGGEETKTETKASVETPSGSASKTETVVEKKAGENPPATPETPKVTPNAPSAAGTLPDPLGGRFFFGPEL